MSHFHHPLIGDWALRQTNGRRVRLAFAPSGLPEVRGPRSLTKSRAEKFLLKNLDWLKQHQAPVVTFLPGSRIVDYTLTHQRADEGKVLVDRRNKLLIVTSSDDISSIHIQRLIWPKASSLLTSLVKEPLVEQVEELSARHDLAPKQVTVRAMSSRWGSCSSRGRVSVSSFLYYLPLELRQYVIEHELAHLAEPHHGADFWQRLMIMNPQAKHLRKVLGGYRPTFYL